MKPARSTSDETAKSAGSGRRSSRTAASLGIAAGCYALAMSVFGTTLSLFLADAVGAGPGLIGLYFMGCAVAGIGINLAVGRLSDRLPDRRIALSSTALAGVAGALVFAGARDYAVVFATGAVLLGLNEAYISQMFAYVKEFSDHTGREVTPFSSTVRSVFSAGWVIGPPVGLFLLIHAGFGHMYAGAAGLLLLTAILGRWFLPALPAPPRPEPRDTAQRRGSAIRRLVATVPSRSWLLLGAVTAVNVANGMYIISIALYVTKDLHLSPSLVGLMAGVCAALEIPLMITVGRLADRIGRTRVVAAAVILAVFFFGLLPMAGPAPCPRSTPPPFRSPSCWAAPSPERSPHRPATAASSGSAPVSAHSPPYSCSRGGLRAAPGTPSGPARTRRRLSTRRTRERADATLCFGRRRGLPVAHAGRAVPGRLLGSPSETLQAESRITSSASKTIEAGSLRVPWMCSAKRRAISAAIFSTGWRTVVKAGRHVAATLESSKPMTATS